MATKIKSLEKTLRIIEFLSKKKSCSLTDISNETGINKATAYRLLATLEDNGYVFQSPLNQQYMLTVKFLHIGHSAINSDLVAFAKPVLVKLQNSFNETINLMTRENDHIIFQDKLEPKQAAFHTRTYVGMNNEIYCTAGGKALLAYYPIEEQKLYWKRNHQAMKKYTKNTIIDEDEFFKELEKIKELGYATDSEENEAGISCVAVPYLDNSHLPIFTISISTLTPRLLSMGIKETADNIKEAMKELRL